MPAILADIAHALSSMQDWEARVSHSLSLLCDVYPDSGVLLGIQTGEWQFFHCNVHSSRVEALETLLRRHYMILTGEEQVRSAMRASGEYAGYQPIRESAADIGSFLSMPAVGVDEIIGILHIYSDQKDAYSVEDVTLISVAASQLGSYLSSVMAFRKEEVARREIEQLKSQAENHLRLLQRALIPEKPMVPPGYDIASAYVPEGGQAEIGGDFYDVFPTENGKVGIMIGDVSGKGVSAASLAAATRSTLRAFAYELSSAAGALTHADAVLSGQQISESSFVSAFLIILNPDTGEFVYSSAGHPPAVLHHANDANLLMFGHPPLGLAQNEYEEAAGKLGPGDRIVLYTDAIIEARHNAEMLGTDGLISTILQSGGLSPAGLVSELLAAATCWSKGPLSDDAAIIVVERKA